MTVLQSHDVWICHVRILVDFVRIVRRYASFSSEGELCDDVDNFVFISCSFFAVLRLAFLSCILANQIVNCGRKATLIVFGRRLGARSSILLSF